MAQKDAIGQDMFLIGATGPMRRWLALHFAEAQGREVDVVALTRDTTESDLKQRREIGAGGSVLHIDQAVVKAAVLGRILVLEGLEKVERNVLPVVNNLLENREMHLDDGRFLVAPQRYDALLAAHGRQHVEALRLERVSPRFRVIALGVPVPPFPGNPLDPPLRSRFQARRIDRMPASLLLRCLASARTAAEAGSAGAESSSTEMEEKLRVLVSAYEAVWELGVAQGAASGGESREVAFERLLYPSEPALVSAARLLRIAPGTSAEDAVHRILPVLHAAPDADTRALLVGVLPEWRQRRPPPPPLAGPLARLAPGQAALTARLGASLGAGSHALLIGPRGSGKSAVARALLAAEGYEPVETLVLYKDMTSRDLLQSRATTAKGETVWRDSCVARAARLGRAVVLDGVDRLAPGVLGALSRLLEDGEATLSDGTHLVSQSRLDAIAEFLGLSPEDLTAAHQVQAVHQRFRVVALAAPPDAKNPWLTNELAHSFHFFAVSESSEISATQAASELLRHIATQGAPAPQAELDTIDRLCELALRLAGVATDGGAPVAELSARALRRLWRRAAGRLKDLPGRVADALLLDFLPPQERATVRAALEVWPGLPPAPPAFSLEIHADEAAGELLIGATVCPLRQPENPGLVPDITFFDIPMHTHILESMLKDFLLGEHLLLIGNQGVGKNKLVDRLLQLLRQEREYVQLHRDTTVQALTLLPSLRGGVVVYDDSPLVKALRHGRVLVVDEFDKAPAEVVCILKGLLEDGEVLLADGRRFVDPRRSGLAAGAFPAEERSRVVEVHPGFRLFALANRPGFPFLGNDFFREMGDVFAVHAVPNPDHASEVAMLQGYAPRVPRALVEKLAAAFGELRQMADDGLVSYPYSTREVVNVVRHLDRFPRDSITEVVENVFGFDFDPDLRGQLHAVFRRHGIPVAQSGGAALESGPEVEEGGVSAEDRTCLAAEVEASATDVSHRLAVVPGSEILLEISPLVPAERWVPSALQYPVDPSPDAGRWRPLEGASSARVGRFAEEVVGWRVGGAEPVAMAALRRSVFVLSQHELRQFDLEWMRWRHHDLRLARLVPGLHRGLAAAGDWLLAYGEHERVAQLLRPFAEPHAEVVPLRVEPFPEAAEARGRVQVLVAPAPFMPCFVLYGVGGRHLVLLCPRTERLRTIALPPGLAPQGLEAVEALGGTPVTAVFLLRVVGRPLEVWRLTLPVARTRAAGAPSSPLDFLGAAARLERLRIDSVMEDVQALGSMPPVLGQIGDDAVPVSSGLHTQQGLHAIAGASSMAGGFTDGLLSGPFADLICLQRPSGADPALFGDAPGTPPFLRKRRASAWLAGARTACTLTSSPLAVALDVVSFPPGVDSSGSQSATFRSILLSRQPQDLLPFLAPPERRSDAVFLREHGMPHVLQAVEVPGDGTLAVLLADGQVRILELRQERLAEDLALWHQMVAGDSSAVGDPPDGAVVAEDEGAAQGSGGRSIGEAGARRGEGEAEGEAEGGGQGGSGSRSASGPAAEGGGSGKRGINFDPEAVHQQRRPGGALAAALQPPLDPEEMERLEREGESALQAAREKARQAVAEQRKKTVRLVGPWDELQYGRIYGSVQREIAQLRVVLAAAEAKERERSWLRNQAYGELDDARLVDGVAGERNVFKRRGQQDPVFGRVQRLPKRLSFVVDVSSSMARMNGDGRLDRLAATSVMIMEAFHGFEARFRYDIVGHSGETEALDLVAAGRPPRDAKERLEVVRNMYSHAGGAMSGDTTLAATLRAIREMAKEEADDRFVFVVSDANLAQYGVHPKVMAKALQEDPRVGTYAFFIAGVEQAEELRRAAPPGRVFTVLDTRELPAIFRRIFAAAVLRDV